MIATDTKGRAPLLVGSTTGALAAIWFVMANAIWNPEEPPFWAFLTLVGLIFVTLVAAGVEVKRRFSDR